MKLKLLKGTVHNACSRVTDFPFLGYYLEQNELPAKGKWIVDLKNNRALDQNDRPLILNFTDLFHKWFLNEIKNANVPLNKIDEAKLTFNFDIRNKKAHVHANCIIRIGKNKYEDTSQFNLY